MTLDTKVLLVLALVISLSGLATIFLRRRALWTLSGQLTAIKGIILGSLAVGGASAASAEQILVLALIALGVGLILAGVGMAVMIRCRRFDGTLDYAEETELKN